MTAELKYETCILFVNRVIRGLIRSVNDVESPYH